VAYKQHAFTIPSSVFSRSSSCTDRRNCSFVTDDGDYHRVCCFLRSTSPNLLTTSKTRWDSPSFNVYALAESAQRRTTMLLIMSDIALARSAAIHPFALLGRTFSENNSILSNMNHVLFRICALVQVQLPPLLLRVFGHGYLSW